MQKCMPNINICESTSSYIQKKLLISEYFRDDECDDEVKITLNSHHESNKCRKRLKRVMCVSYRIYLRKPTSIKRIFRIYVKFIQFSFKDGGGGGWC